MFGASPNEKAYFAPFVVFMALQVLGQAVGQIFAGQAFWAFAQPQYWVQPAQTLICGGLLIRSWRHYSLRWPRGWGFTVFAGLLSLGLWISPQLLFGAAPRLEGFEPGYFGQEGWPYALNLAMRFIRLVVVVPLVEELFWRGYLLRWLIDEDFTRVPIGQYQHRAFAIVAVLFMFEHQPVDYPAALATGALFNLVAVRTGSLSACVVAHALTNFLLGLFILWSGQWGFW